MQTAEEELDIIEALLLENGIDCHRKRCGSLFVMSKWRTLYLFIDHERFTTGYCRRPDINDPNFIEDTKDMIEICEGSCEACSRYKPWTT